MTVADAVEIAQTCTLAGRTDLIAGFLEANDSPAKVRSQLLAAQAEASGVKIKTATVSADLVGDAIIAAAKKHDSDTIVMASHGRQGIKRLLLGSETQHVLTHSDLPVLVLR